MADRPERGIFGTATYWRASMTMPRFLMFDARLIAAFLLLIFHLRLWTFFVLLGTAVVLYGVEHYGYRLPNALRRVRALIAGRYRPARPGRYYRSARDLGFETHPLTAHTLDARRAALAKTIKQSEAIEAAMKPAGPKPSRRPSKAPMDAQPA